MDMNTENNYTKLCGTMAGRVYGTTSSVYSAGIRRTSR